MMTPIEDIVDEGEVVGDVCDDDGDVAVVAVVVVVVVVMVSMMVMAAP